MLDLKANINYKRKNKTSLINFIQFASHSLSKIKKLTNTTNVNINKKDDVYESLLIVATQNKNDNVVTILLNYKVDVYKNSFLSNAI